MEFCPYFNGNLVKLESDFKFPEDCCVRKCRMTVPVFMKSAVGRFGEAALPINTVLAEVMWKSIFIAILGHNIYRPSHLL